MTISFDHRRLTGLISGMLAIAVAMAFSPAQAAPKHAASRRAGMHKSAPASTAPRLTPLPAKPASLPPMTPVRAVPAAPPSPVTQAGDTLLYDGQSPDAAKVSIASWGGGAVEDNAQVSFSKGHSLKVTTLDPYQGARMSFQTPADLGIVTDTARTMVLTLRLTADTRVLPPIPPPTQNGPDNGGPDDNGGQMDQGGQMDNGGQMDQGRRLDTGEPQIIMAQFLPPADGNAQPTTPAGTDAASSPPVQGLTRLHLIFTLANGAQADIERPYPDLSKTNTGAGAEQWVTIGVPLSILHFSAPGGGSPLQSITIAGDDYAVFYVGQIKVTQDTAPVTCFAGVDDASVARDTPITLRGTASGGYSVLNYSWDFDASDGIAEQATGMLATTQYAKGPQDYKVTLTVTDVDGLKKPAVSTVTLHVQ